MLESSENLYLEMNATCGALMNACVDANRTGDSSRGFYEMSQFLTGIILYPIIIIVGVIGNILTLVVLSDKKMLTSTNIFLTALAVSDIIKLLNDSLYFIVSILLRSHPLAGNRMLGYMYPFSHYIFNEAVSVSAWLTVSVAMERYISVCHATKARGGCTLQRAGIVSAMVFVSMSIVALPSAFRYTRTSYIDSNTNITMHVIEPSVLGRNNDFMTVYTWVLNLLRSIIPLFVLICLNTLIIHALRRERVIGKRMTSRNRITLMLIVVVIVFIVCIFPDAILSTVFGFGYVDEAYLVKGIREFTDLLLSLNSAVNFMIYCMCSRNFRDVFSESLCSGETILCCWPGRERCARTFLRRGSLSQTRDKIRGKVVATSIRLEGSGVNMLLQPRVACRTVVVCNGHHAGSYTGPQTNL